MDNGQYFRSRTRVDQVYKQLQRKEMYLIITRSSHLQTIRRTRVDQVYKQLQKEEEIDTTIITVLLISTQSTSLLLQLCTIHNTLGACPHSLSTQQTKSHMPPHKLPTIVYAVQDHRLLCQCTFASHQNRSEEDLVSCQQALRNKQNLSKSSKNTGAYLEGEHGEWQTGESCTKTTSLTLPLSQMFNNSRKPIPEQDLVIDVYISEDHK